MTTYLTIIYKSRKANKRQFVSSSLRHGAYSGQRWRLPTGLECCRGYIASNKGWFSSFCADMRAKTCRRKEIMVFDDVFRKNHSVSLSSETSASVNPANSLA